MKEMENGNGRKTDIPYGFVGAPYSHFCPSSNLHYEELGHYQETFSLVALSLNIWSA